jgi:flagellin
MEVIIMFSVSQANAIYGINNSNKQMENLNLQLMTGKRINRAADDSSGMAIANQLKSQANGLGQAIKNSNEAISLTNIADGALEEYTNILMKARDKASQAISDSNSDDSRAALEADVKALMESAEVIANQTQYNGINLLDGSFTNKKFQTGAYSGQTTSISIADTKTATLGIDDVSLDLTTSAGAESALTAIDAAIKTLDGIRSGIGSVTQGLESRVRNMTTTQTNVLSAESNIRDVDEAQARADLDKWNIRSQASTFAFQMSQQTQQNILRLFQ